MNLGNKPVEILIEDAYLLVVPSPQTNVNPNEIEEREQAAKAERLENAELLHMQGQTDTATANLEQSQGLWSSLITKVINNLQVTVKNIHIRYEDELSVPGVCAFFIPAPLCLIHDDQHPFAAGVTLAGFTAISVGDDWQPAFIQSTAGAVRKVGSHLSKHNLC